MAASATSLRPAAKVATDTNSTVELPSMHFRFIRGSPSGPCYRRYFPDECRTCPECLITDFRSAPALLGMPDGGCLSSFRSTCRPARGARRSEDADWSFPCWCRTERVSDPAMYRHHLVSWIDSRPDAPAS